MVINILFLLLVSFEPVWVHHLIFAEISLFSLSSLLIWLQYFLFFGFFFTFRRSVVAVVVVFVSLVLLLLMMYHRYFAEPLMLLTVFSQAREGLTFAGRSPESLFTPAFFGFTGLIILKLLFIYCCYHPLKRGCLIRTAALLPFTCITVMSYGFFHNSKFEKNDFNRIASQFGYVQAWGYELVTKLDRENLINDIIDSSASEPEPVPEELKEMQIPDNVYVVQLESIDYGALSAAYNGKKLMPFMSGLVPDGCLYIIEAHDKEASANADFSILTGTELYISMYSVIYGLFPSTRYDEMFTLPKLFKSAGYTSRFYHGFLGRFFNRKEHIQAMGFDKIWFSENLPLNVPEGAWGYDDADLFTFVVSDNAENAAPKNFNFIISVSSHEDFQIGTSHQTVVKYPADMTERFYNAAHYVDSALKQLIETAPEESLFVIYSDHYSNIMKDKRTFMLIYRKNAAQKACRHVIEVGKTAKIIKSLFSQIKSPADGALKAVY